MIGYVKSLVKFMNLPSLGEESGVGRFLRHCHPVINSLCSLLLCVWVDLMYMKTYYFMRRLCSMAQLTVLKDT